MAYVLDWGIVAGDFALQWLFSVHFSDEYPSEKHDILYPASYGLNNIAWALKKVGMP